MLALAHERAFGVDMSTTCGVSHAGHPTGTNVTIAQWRHNQKLSHRRRAGERQLKAAIRSLMTLVAISGNTSYALARCSRAWSDAVAAVLVDDDGHGAARAAAAIREQVDDLLGAYMSIPSLRQEAMDVMAALDAGGQ